VKITEVITGILRERGWGLYDRQDPIQKLPVSGETPLLKVNEVELKYLIEEVEKAMEEEKWKNSDSDGNQQNTSQIG
tara:strand:+ start:184 stop:414 length:231 start_codon:yes stop_codon:yes gene_type:complete